MKVAADECQRLRKCSEDTEDGCKSYPWRWFNWTFKAKWEMAENRGKNLPNEGNECAGEGDLRERVILGLLGMP